MTARIVGIKAVVGVVRDKPGWGAGGGGYYSVDGGGGWIGEGRAYG